MRPVLAAATPSLIGYCALLLVFAGSGWRMLRKALFAFSGHDYRLQLARRWTEKAGMPEATEASGRLAYTASFDLINQSRDREYLVSHMRVKACAVAKDEALSRFPAVALSTRLIAPDQRTDGYWPVWAVEGQTRIQVQVEVAGLPRAQLEDCAAIWVTLVAEAQGPHGIETRRLHSIFSPERASGHSTGWKALQAAESWRPKSGGNLLRVRTPILTESDNIFEVIETFVLPLSRPGDIVAIAESPLAIMQGRYVDPQDIKPGWIARSMCLLCPTKTTFGRPHGMQALINEIGRITFLRAMLIGQIAKRLKIRGAFYRACGEQSILMDDISGTLPPYDNFLVKGPVRTRELVQAIRERYGLEAAVVDISDITRNNTVLAHSEGTDSETVLRFMAGNPAGNGGERSPLVLLRPEAP